MHSRRDFIKNGFRMFSLAVLASTTGYLLFREESDTLCDLDFVCGNCNKLSKCSLPEAKRKRTEKLIKRPDASTKKTSDSAIK